VCLEADPVQGRVIDLPAKVDTFVQLLGHVDEGAAVALLNHDLAAFGVCEVDAGSSLTWMRPPSCVHCASRSRGFSGGRFRLRG